MLFSYHSKDYEHHQRIIREKYTFLHHISSNRIFLWTYDKDGFVYYSVDQFFQACGKLVQRLREYQIQALERKH